MRNMTLLLDAYAFSRVAARGIQHAGGATDCTRAGVQFGRRLVKTRIPAPGDDMTHTARTRYWYARQHTSWLIQLGWCRHVLFE